MRNTDPNAKDVSYNWDKEEDSDGDSVLMETPNEDSSILNINRNDRSLSDL